MNVLSRRISCSITCMQCSNECSSCERGRRSRRAMRCDVTPSPAGTQNPPTPMFLPPDVQQQISKNFLTRQPRARSSGG